MQRFFMPLLGNPTSWNREFGDGTGSSEQNPSHIYPFEGSYDVRLTVSNQYGSDSVFKTGSTFQRGNAAPVPLTTMITQKTIIAPSSQAQANGTTTPALPAATQAPLSPFVTNRCNSYRDTGNRSRIPEINFSPILFFILFPASAGFVVDSCNFS